MFLSPCRTCDKEARHIVILMLAGICDVMQRSGIEAAAANVQLISYQFTVLRPGAAAFESAVSSVSKYGGAAAGYRTMLDALLPASKTLNEVGVG